MKKMSALIVLSVLVSSTSFCANGSQKKTSPKLVSIDSVRLMTMSKEGKKLEESVKEELVAFQKSVQSAQKELIDFQEKVSKQAKVLSKEAMLEKGETLTKMKKKAERELSDKEDALKMSIKRRQVLLSNKQLDIAKKVFEDNNYGMMIDKNTPGVLFVNNAIDVTEKVLEKVDAEYSTRVAKKVVSKEKSKATKAA